MTPPGPHVDTHETKRPARPVPLEGTRKQALETSRNRLVVTAVVFALAFAMVSGRLVELAVFKSGGTPSVRVAHTSEPARVRADITDRNGVLLATSMPTASIFANPRHILDPREATTKLAKTFPDMNAADLLRKLSSDKSFVWIRRNLTPKQQAAINDQGIPGIYFRQTERRVYPHGRLAGHVTGTTDIDGNGLGGIELSFDKRLRDGGAALHLALDIRLQSILRRELRTAIDKFSAIGGAGVVLDVHTGETLAIVSLPDFDPNQPSSLVGEAAFNRATKGVYEMGSTFKLFTAAMALDSGVTRLGDKYDATKPIRIARFLINDYHAKNRWLTVPEIIVYSSNIGSAKMALDVGTEAQRRYLRAFGMLSPASIEIPEVGAPLVPSPWREINTMTISYGHGIAVTPIQLAAGISALVNGGVLRQPTLVARGNEADVRRGPDDEVHVISERTSKQVRQLMRLVVRNGTGKKAGVPGYRVGGKTGTADKSGAGGYTAARGVMSSFVAAYPMDDPRYVVFAMVDEPKGIKETFGYATGGWVAAPVVSQVVRQMAPMMGMKPATDAEREPKPGEALYISTARPRASGGRGQQVAAN